MPAHHALFDSALHAALLRWSLPITAPQAYLLRKHFEAVVATNRVMNLTRITDPVEAAVKHYTDSLSLVSWSRDRSIAARTVLDIGTGAGFPALPLAVMSPEWVVTAIDAKRKKVEFLERTAAAMGLDNLRVEHAHTGHWQTEQTFDVVAARAFGPLGRCLELGARFVTPGGFLIVYKTKWLTLGEYSHAGNMLRPTRMRADEPFGYDLQLGAQTLPRALHAFRRVH